jgi:hypothetical protein
MATRREVTNWDDVADRLYALELKVEAAGFSAAKEEAVVARVAQRVVDVLTPVPLPSTDVTTSKRKA